MIAVLAVVATLTPSAAEAADSPRCSSRGRCSTQRSPLPRAPTRPPAGLRKGDYKVRITVKRAGSRTTTSTLTTRKL